MTPESAQAGAALVSLIEAATGNLALVQKAIDAGTWEVGAIMARDPATGERQQLLMAPLAGDNALQILQYIKDQYDAQIADASDKLAAL